MPGLGTDAASLPRGGPVQVLDLELRVDEHWALNKLRLRPDTFLPLASTSLRKVTMGTTRKTWKDWNVCNMAGLTAALLGLGALASLTHLELSVDDVPKSLLTRMAASGAFPGLQCLTVQSNWVIPIIDYEPQPAKLMRSLGCLSAWPHLTHLDLRVDRWPDGTFPELAGSGEVLELVAGALGSHLQQVRQHMGWNATGWERTWEC